jgi:hypothetical protein
MIQTHRRPKAGRRGLGGIVPAERRARKGEERAHQWRSGGVN